MNRHSVFFKAITERKGKSTKKLIKAENLKRNKDLQSKITNPKSKIKMAERTGVEPAYPYGRRFSRPLHYHYAISPHERRIENITQNKPFDNSKK